MNLKAYFFFLCLLIFSLSGISQDKYWVIFTDKGNLTDIHPESFLSDAALDNRLRQGISIDYYDYPVSESYIQQLKDIGIPILHKSKWLNAVSTRLFPEQVSHIRTLAFVRHVQAVFVGSKPMETMEVMEDCPEVPHVDTHWRQLEMLGMEALHRNQYTGAGITIAVFDNGYFQVDSLLGFKHLFEEERILASRDYVDGDANVFGSCSHCKHGTWVLSVLAAKLPGKILGGAPDASYILLRTENDASETHQEEDNWIAAAEFADSMGAQIFTTSLGYSTFDAGEGNYSRMDMDGNTALITRAADLAASRGIIVINSAGNSGGNGIVAPADGDSVIAVGAVDACEEVASFSSQGPSADGRIKPDLAAMGKGIYVLDIDGNIRLSNGTSFSCPMISGLTACLLQAQPNTRNMEMYQALIQSADRYQNPDKYYGYGIPNASAALDILGKPNSFRDINLYEDPFEHNQLLVYPSPNQGSFKAAIGVNMVSDQVRLEVIDVVGRRVIIQYVKISPTEYLIELPALTQSGIYTLRFLDEAQKSVYYSTKFVVMIP